MVPALAPAAFGIATLTGAAAGAVLRGVCAPRSQLLAPSIAQVPNRFRQIALTFEDGPSESTPALLELLARYRVRATFFVCGKNVKRLPHIARAIVTAGHELGNHTHHHTRLCPQLGPGWNLLSAGDVLLELRKAQTCIHHHTGVWPRYFRAPDGLRWFGLRGAQRKIGVQGVTGSVQGHDLTWDHEQIAAHLLQQTEPGGIVCLHDGSGLCADPDIRMTLAALEAVLPAWKARGFRIGTVHELMRAGARRRRAGSRRSSVDLLPRESSAAR